MTPTPPNSLLPSPAETERISFFKRFKMERDLEGLAAPALPPEYSWLPWERSLLDAHARTLYACFHDEIDGAVFRSFKTPGGCLSLMLEISCRPGFVPAATWLIACDDGIVGTVQGLCQRPGLGAVQNIGVLAGHRGRGLGTALLWRALHGFRAAGLGRAMLEVTAQNEGAVRLYQRMGFRRRKTVYKVVTRDL